MIQAPSTSRPVRLVAGPVIAAMLLLGMAPAASADETIDYVADFQIVSTTIDMGTDRPTITYTFRCLEQIDYMRIRSTLVQRHAGVADYGVTLQTSAEFDCQAGATVTLPVGYGGQQGSYHPGHAMLTANLYAYEDAYTVDSASINATVLLLPSHRAP